MHPGTLSLPLHTPSILVLLAHLIRKLSERQVR